MLKLLRTEFYDYDHSKVSKEAWSLRNRLLVCSGARISKEHERSNTTIIILAFYFTMYEPFSNVPGKGSLQL